MLVRMPGESAICSRLSPRAIAMTSIPSIARSAPMAVH
jgi:hypothetical protein